MVVADIKFCCFVGGLTSATNDRALEQAFEQYGEVINSNIINDQKTGRSRGFEFVSFSDEKSMNDAIEAMNGQELDGRKITVNQARSRRSRLGRRGGGDRGSRGL